jgi:hypothetical protein
VRDARIVKRLRDVFEKDWVETVPQRDDRDEAPDDGGKAEEKEALSA